MAAEIKTTVRCPLCGVLVPGVVDTLTRTDILMGHIISEHGFKARPASPMEGPPLPRGLGIRWPWRK